MHSIQLTVQLKILNSGSHFGEDKFAMVILYAMLIVVFIGLAYVNWQRYLED